MVTATVVVVACNVVVVVVVPCEFFTLPAASAGWWLGDLASLRATYKDAGNESSDNDHRGEYHRDLAAVPRLRADGRWLGPGALQNLSRPVQ